MKRRRLDNATTTAFVCEKTTKDWLVMISRRDELTVSEIIEKLILKAKLEAGE